MERFIDLMEFVRFDHINFARLDLIELYPERVAELRASAYQAAVEFHMLEPILGANSIQTARAEGLLPNRV